MKRKLITVSVVVVILAAIYGINQLEPERLSDRRQQATEETQRQVAQAEAAEQSAQDEQSAEAEIETKGDVPKPDKPLKPVEKSFRVKFECSNGDFVLEIHPEWAPNGAARFKDIIEKGIYDDARFFRVISTFMVQWGIPGDPKVTTYWKDARIPTDPVKKSNKPGMVSFAMLSGDTGSRTTQVFISYADNAFLDPMGFAPFGEVVEGMDVVKSINGQYAGKPSDFQVRIQSQGNEFLNSEFPNLDYIKKATIVD